MTKELIATPCFKCSNLTAVRCSKCKTTAYCSKDCQAEDWNVHKIFCQSLPFPESQKALDLSLRKIKGILLKPNSLKPSLIEVQMDVKFGDKMLPNTKSLISADESYNYMQRNHVKKANLKDTLVFTFRDDFLNDGSPPNMCIQKIYKGKNNYPWCGPVLVLKLKGLNVSNNEYTDMTPKDFEDVVDYFCWYGKSEESRFESTIEEVKFG